MIPHIVVMGVFFSIAFVICWLTAWRISVSARGGLVWWLVGGGGIVFATIPMFYAILKFLYIFDLTRPGFLLQAIYGAVSLTITLVKIIWEWRTRRT
jgi:hypothetical protein